MSHDLLEQLSAGDVPPPPADFDREVHRRLNRALTAGHMVEFAFEVVPYALGHLAAALLGFVVFTLSGRFPTGTKKHS